MRRLRFLLCLLLLPFLTGCIVPLSWEQESDWRWKQYDPNYQPDYTRGR